MATTTAASSDSKEDYRGQEEAKQGTHLDVLKPVVKSKGKSSLEGQPA